MIIIIESNGTIFKMGKSD